MSEDYFSGMSKKDIESYKEAELKINQEAEKQQEKDYAVLMKVEELVSSEFFEQICESMEESEHCINYRIVDYPTGQLQGNMADEFKEWVDQFDGQSGDDYHGYVYIELPDGKYLAWDYWM